MIVNKRLLSKFSLLPCASKTSDTACCIFKWIHNFNAAWLKLSHNHLSYSLLQKTFSWFHTINLTNEAKWNKDTPSVIWINYPKAVCNLKIGLYNAWTRYFFHLISITDLNWDSWIKQEYPMIFLLNSHCRKIYACIRLMASTWNRHPFKVAANF